MFITWTPMILYIVIYASQFVLFALIFILESLTAFRAHCRNRLMSRQLRKEASRHGEAI